ncbi:hypothetical protein ACSBR2_003155 [Camellia fascicularis]
MEVGSQGSAGGIICVWDPEFFQLEECYGSRNFLLLKGTIYHSFNCVLMNVYASTDVSKRGRLWEIIKQLRSNFPSPWCLRGCRRARGPHAIARTRCASRFLI